MYAGHASPAGAHYGRVPLGYPFHWATCEQKVHHRMYSYWVAVPLVVSGGDASKVFCGYTGGHFCRYGTHCGFLLEYVRVLR